MSVIKKDGEGNFKKRLYFKDGYPQKVFKDGKLIFPDFCMVNSGGHGQKGEAPHKSSIFGGSFGFNALFQPYSSKEIRQGSVQSNVYSTTYYTDSVVYGDGCKLSDTFNLGKLRIHKQGENNFPRSSCGDCIVIDGDTFRDYFSQLSYSSNSFLYCKISADVDTISSYAKKNNIPISDINMDASYNPKLCFGINYNMYSTSDSMWGNMQESEPLCFKKYRTTDPCSQKVDIECVLNDDNIFCGYTNKYFNGSKKSYESIANNTSSMFVNAILKTFDNNNSQIDRSKFFISPNFEYYKGLIKLKNGTSADLYINGLCSGEWGASIDRETPKEFTLCENLNYDLKLMPCYNSYIWGENRGLYMYTAKNGNDTIFTLSSNDNDYPFNKSIYKDFYNYLIDEGKIQKTLVGYLSSYPTNVTYSCEDYINGVSATYELNPVTRYGSPAFLNCNMVDVKPSTGRKFTTFNGAYNLEPLIDLSPKTEYGAALFSYLNSFSDDSNYISKVLFKCEFEARLKFKPSKSIQLPIVLYPNFRYNLKGFYYEPQYMPIYEVGYTNKNMKNDFGDDWYVDEKWRKYGYSIVSDVFNANCCSVSGNTRGDGYMLCIPYITIMGESIWIYKAGVGTFYEVPYEVRNVTTKLYI